MKKDPALFLQHILESIAAIEEYTSGLSETSFLSDRRTPDAVVWRLGFLGRGRDDMMITELSGLT
jgi:uncharacterized protein with HEPN domain